MKSQYLGMALSIGMDVKSAMLTEISVIYEICKAKAEARKEMQHHG